MKQTNAGETTSVVVVELSVPTDAFAVGSVLHGHGGGDAHVEFAEFVPIGETMAPYFWVETDNTDAFEEGVRADDRVEHLTTLDSRGSRTLYEIAWGDVDDEFLSAVADHGLVVKRAAGDADRWCFQLQGPDRGNLSSFRDALREKGVPVTIRRVWNPEVPDGNRYGLTQKQRETLELAFGAGYFEVPRGASLTDLSETLGISHQSVSRRIRGGLRNLLAHTLMDDPDAEGEDR